MLKNRKFKVNFILFYLIFFSTANNLHSKGELLPVSKGSAATTSTLRTS
jgi:hypothetical protein